MRCLYKTSVVVAAFAGVTLLAATPADAIETSNSEFVIIPQDDVLADDLYAGAIKVVVEGTLDGDLIAFAGEEVVINGVVTGSVVAVTPSVRVTGNVGGSLRVAANRLEISGSIGGDLVGVAVDAELAGSSTVSGDVLMWAWSTDALGTIGGTLTGSQRSLDLAGEVHGDVEVSVGRLDVVDRLEVGGDLGYRSRRDAEGLASADVSGAVVHQSPLPPNLRVRALGLLGRFLVVLFLALSALIAAYGWPERTSMAVAEVGRGPLRRWAIGAAILAAPLLVSAVTGLIVGLAPASAALPLLLVLIPVILALAGISFALAFVAWAPVVGWLGGVVFRRLDIYGAILAGSIVTALLWYLPVIGWIVPILVLPLGLGSWLGAWRQASGSSPSTEGSSSSSFQTEG